MTIPADQGASAPYAPVNGDEFFELPVSFGDPIIARMSDVVGLSTNATIAQIFRYIAEVKLIQQALGVKPDGIIGPHTRRAARDLSTRIPIETVKAAFVTCWKAAFDLGREADAAKMPPVVRQTTGYLHDLLVQTFRNLSGDGLYPSERWRWKTRPVFIPVVESPVERVAEAFSATTKSIDGATNAFVDLGRALLTAENERLRAAVEWLVANPTHVSQQGRRKIEETLRWSEPR